MKKPFVLGLLAMLLTPLCQAGFTYCEKIGGACGEEYTCTAYGWAQRDPYCSPTNQSSSLRLQPGEAPRPRTCQTCTGEPVQDEYCQVECGCGKSPFCGMW